MQGWIILVALCIMLIACVLAGIWYDDPANREPTDVEEDCPEDYDPLREFEEPRDRYWDEP